MKKFLRSELEAMSLGELMTMLNPDYNIGATHYPTPVSEDGEYLKNPKRWMIQNDHRIIAESIDWDDEIDDDARETFGYDIDIVRKACGTTTFGNTPKECLVNFFITHPELIV